MDATVRQMCIRDSVYINYLFSNRLASPTVGHKGDLTLLHNLFGNNMHVITFIIITHTYKIFINKKIFVPMGAPTSAIISEIFLQI